MRRRTVQPSRLSLVLAIGVVGLLLAPAAAMAGAFTPESGGSPNAENIDSLYRIVLYVAIPIFLIVEGTLIWSLVKFRQRRGGPEPAQIRGNSPLELGWTVGAALILVVLAVVTFLYLGDIKNPPPSGPNGLASASTQVASIDQPDPPRGSSEPLSIDVNGQQYLWRYDHPGDEVYDYYELVVPTDTTISLEIRASDVMHSWWIPELGGKVDAVPGHTNETWFKISKPGVYRGQCAELCGAGHADMRARVRAVSPDEYRSYVEDRKTEIKQAQEGLAQQRTEREGDPE